MKAALLDETAGRLELADVTVDKPGARVRC